MIASASFRLRGPLHWLPAKLILSEPPRCCINIILTGWCMPQPPCELNFTPDHTWDGEAEKGVILTFPVASLSQLTTVPLLPMNLQAVSFQKWENAFACLIAEVLVSGIHCHKRATSTSVCAFVYFTVLYRVLQYLYFKPRMSRSKYKSHCDISGTVLFTIQYWNIKNILFLCVCFLCIICVRSIINLS